MGKIILPEREPAKESDDPKAKALAAMYRFCAPGDTRYSLNHPFVHEPWAYASDTHILVRMPRNMLPEELVAVDGQPPKIGDIFTEQTIRDADFDAEVDLGSGDVVSLAKSSPCPDCSGRGHVRCYRCDNTYPCDTCEGSGRIVVTEDCPECGGTGRVGAIMLGGKKYNPHYIRLVQEVFGEADWGLAADGKKAVFVLSGEIAGCLMCVDVGR